MTAEPVSNDVTLKNATEAESHDRVIREVSPLSEEEEVAKPWKIDLNEIEFREYVRIQLAKAKVEKKLRKRSVIKERKRRSRN